MSFEATIVKLLSDATSWVVNKATLSAGRRNGARLISEATQELLSVSPNRSKVRSLLNRAEKILPESPPELFQARDLLDVVNSAEAKRTARKKSAKRKAAKKKSAKRKAAKKKASKR